MNNKSDLHLHTLVSDGKTDAMAMLTAAREIGLKQISITDHDALGAYRHFHDNLFTQAKKMGLELIAGIELDTDYLGKEVHLLGYHIDLDNGPLNAHLDHTQSKRREKVTQQIAAINAYFGQTVIETREVILPKRDTLMKPHLVHGLLNRKLFGEYKEAQKWLAETIDVRVNVPKLPIIQAIELLHGAGGQAVLAHPGYLSHEHNLCLEDLLTEMKAAGLDGLELEYPYLGTSMAFDSLESETKIIAQLRELATRFDLFTTRGSDAHEPDKLKSFASRCF